MVKGIFSAVVLIFFCTDTIITLVAVQLLMKIRTLTNLTLVFVVSILSLVGCSRLSGASFAQNPDLPYIEVTELSEPFDAFLAYNAVLRAPVGTVIETERSGTYTMLEPEYSFALSHYMYNGIEAIRPPGVVGAGIDTTYASSQSHSKVLFNPISGYVNYSDEGPIENYGDFPSPGTYQLNEGDTFVLAEIEKTVFSITVVDIPDEPSE